MSKKELKAPPADVNWREITIGGIIDSAGKRTPF
jgi:hypothetical protein